MRSLAEIYGTSAPIYMKGEFSVFGIMNCPATGLNMFVVLAKSLEYFECPQCHGLHLIAPSLYELSIDEFVILLKDFQGKNENKGN